jgi:Protein of unknown function (DUF2491)
MRIAGATLTDRLRGDRSMPSLAAFATLIRQKLSGEAYHPELFRVGMTLTLDPAPFVLAADKLRVKAPDGAGQLTSVVAVGTVRLGDVVLHRLYLDEASFLQIWLDRAGTVAECRYFARLDQEIPADEAAWAVWLDDARGIIGWPQFQTLDGKLYDRQWSRGTAARIAPALGEEAVASAASPSRRSLRSMLYAAPTGLADPAPPAEYIMVAAVEEGSAAWVDIHAGIDLNPASLTLA